MAGEDPEPITEPIWTATAHRIDIDFYQEKTLQNRKDMTGKTCTVLIDDNGTLRTYAVSWTAQATGQGFITLTSGQHDNPGNEELQVTVDTVVKKEFVLGVRTRVS